MRGLRGVGWRCIPTGRGAVYHFKLAGVFRMTATRALHAVSAASRKHLVPTDAIVVQSPCLLQAPRG